MNGAVIGCFCVAAVLLIMGIVLFTGHGSWLLAGYNTMKKEKREKYDEKKLCRFNLNYNHSLDYFGKYLL